MSSTYEFPDLLDRLAATGFPVESLCLTRPYKRVSAKSKLHAVQKTSGCPRPSSAPTVDVPLRELRGDDLCSKCVSSNPLNLSYSLSWPQFVAAVELSTDVDVLPSPKVLESMVSLAFGLKLLPYHGREAPADVDAFLSGRITALRERSRLLRDRSLTEFADGCLAELALTPKLLNAATETTLLSLGAPPAMTRNDITLAKLAKPQVLDAFNEMLTTTPRDRWPQAAADIATAEAACVDLSSLQSLVMSLQPDASPLTLSWRAKLATVASDASAKSFQDLLAVWVGEVAVDLFAAVAETLLPMLDELLVEFRDPSDRIVVALADSELASLSSRKKASIRANFEVTEVDGFTVFVLPAKFPSEQLVARNHSHRLRVALLPDNAVTSPDRARSLATMLAADRLGGSFDLLVEVAYLSA